MRTGILERTVQALDAQPDANQLNSQGIPIGITQEQYDAVRKAVREKGVQPEDISSSDYGVLVDAIASEMFIACREFPNLAVTQASEVALMSTLTITVIATISTMLVWISKSLETTGETVSPQSQLRFVADIPPFNASHVAEILENHPSSTSLLSEWDRVRGTRQGGLVDVITSAILEREKERIKDHLPPDFPEEPEVNPYFVRVLTETCAATALTLHSAVRTANLNNMFAPPK